MDSISFGSLSLLMDAKKYILKTISQTSESWNAVLIHQSFCKLQKSLKIKKILFHITLLNFFSQILHTQTQSSKTVVLISADVFEQFSV